MLKDSDKFANNFDYLSFQQCWGRYNNWSESTPHGNSYIEPYKNKLLEYFEEGKKNLSKKMNATMMCDQLQKEYPNTFSLPGKTAITQHISSLLVTAKEADKDKNGGDDGDKCDTTIHSSKIQNGNV